MAHALLSLLLLLCTTDALAGRRTPMRICRANCGATIDACVAGGGAPKRCKRSVLRSCRRQGVAVCLPATTQHVAPSGIDDAICGTTDAPCRTIQWVVDRVPVGGAAEIKLAAGVYSDAATCPAGTTPNQAVACILNRRITLVGGFATTDWDTPDPDPSLTVIDGGDQARGVRVQRTGPAEAAASLVIEGVTIRNGRATGATSGTVDQTWAFGGGLLAEHAPVSLTRVVFRDNQAIGGNTSDPEGGRGAGGGIALNAASWSFDSAAATLEDVRFEGNQALGGTGVDKGGFALGGALFTYNASLDADGVVCVGNAATGGASSGNGVAAGERSDALGGAIAIEVGSVATLAHVQATGNVATGGSAPNGSGGGAYGGGVFAELATVTLRDALIEANTAQGGTGHNDDGRGSVATGGGLDAHQTTLTVERARIVGNLAQGGDGTVEGGPATGGGIALNFGAYPAGNVDTPFVLRNAVVADNAVGVGAGTLIGGGGGGASIQAATGTIEHATIAGNRLLDDRLLGAGVGLIAIPGWTTQAAITNTIIADHPDPAFNAGSWANAALWVAQGASAAVTRALFAGNAHDSNAGVSGGLNLPPGAITLTGALSAADAGFVAPGSPSHDYHLSPTSPARDQATSSTVVDDLDGEVRPAGGQSDIGADEIP